NARANDILFAPAANNRVFENVTLNYRVLPRTNGIPPASYFTLGPTGGQTGTAFRNISANLDVDVSGDTATQAVFKILKNTTASLGTTFEDIRVSGYIKGALASAGKIVDVFTSADAPWSGEVSNNIVTGPLLISGS